MLERERVGERDERLGADALALRIAAPLGLAEAVGDADHAVARLVRGARRLDDGAGQVDAEDHRELADDLAARADRQGVFVVERGVANVDEHVAAQVGVVEVAEIDAIAAVDFFGEESAEGHDFLTVRAR